MKNYKTESFPGSRKIALHLFQNLEGKYQANDVLYETYRNFMTDCESLDHMSVASNVGIYYIPYHSFFKDSSASNILRVDLMPLPRQYLSYN